MVTYKVRMVKEVSGMSSEGQRLLPACLEGRNFGSQNSAVKRRAMLGVPWAMHRLVRNSSPGARRG